MKNLTYSELNKRQLEISHFVKTLKKLKTLKSFKLISNEYVVVAFNDDSPLRVIRDFNETIDIDDVTDIFDVQRLHENEANGVIQEMNTLNKEFNNYSFNYRKMNVQQFREIMIKLQEIKLKRIVKLKSLLK